MAAITIPKSVLENQLIMPAEYFEPHWYAAYTRANHEKSVAQQLSHGSVEHFLPLYETLRRWNDRRMRLQLPLFPGYVFVRMALRDRLRVLQIPSVVHLVSFSGIPTPLPESEIEAVQSCLSRERGLEPHPYLRTGRRVRVTGGPLSGQEGIVVRKKNHCRFVISLHLIMRSVSVEISDADLAPV